MKNFNFITLPLLLIVGLITFIGCTKEDKVQNEAERTYDEFISNFDFKENKDGYESTLLKELKSKDSYLVFDNVENFEKALNDIENIDEGELDLWEDNNNLYTLRRVHNNADEELAEIFTEEDFLKFEEKWKGKIYFDYEDQSIDNLLRNYNLASLVNFDGVVKIGEDLHVYKNSNTKVVIKGDDYSKVKIAKNLNESDPSLGLEIFDFNSAKLRHGNYIFEEKTEGNYRLRVWVQENPYYLSDRYPVLAIAIKHYKKGWWWSLKKTDITFSLGFTVSASCNGNVKTQGGGLGWTIYNKKQWSHTEYLDAVPYCSYPHGYIDFNFDVVGGTFGTDNVCLCFFCPFGGSCFDQCDVEGVTCD